MKEHVGAGVAQGRASPEASDGEWVARARAGDHVAFLSLLRLYDDGMRRLAFRLLADVPVMDDVLRAAYVEAYRTLPAYRSETRFRSWLYRLTYDACMHELRQDRPAPVTLASSTPGAAEAVRTALATLPPEKRVVVALVDGEGFDGTRVARILGLPQATVALRLAGARLQLHNSPGPVPLRHLPTPEHRAGFWDGVEGALEPQHLASARPLPRAARPPNRARRAFTLTAAALLLAGIVAAVGLPDTAGPDPLGASSPLVAAADPDGAGAEATVVSWFDSLAAGDMAATWAALGPASRDAWESFEVFEAARTGFSEGLATWAAAQHRTVEATALPDLDGQPAFVVTFTGERQVEGTVMNDAYAVVVRETAAGIYKLEPFTPSDTIGLQFVQPGKSDQPTGWTRDKPVIIGIPDRNTQAWLVIDGSGDLVQPTPNAGQTEDGVELSYLPEGGWPPGRHVVTAHAVYPDGTPAATATVFDVS